ncbi:unnamed protein product [Rotaria socialis]|uniref:Uncharacterized protein n=2 Tax=Rotaria socialis TaxID=392032 RepID=A0A820UUF6_9BILA|nr:unnamed protein product [Rotaria socialis]CAF3746686.1 unnamed protein product [Rotaria socialis]CAF4490527.1 unnamed protein product [Rotaria socialis]
MSYHTILVALIIFIAGLNGKPTTTSLTHELIEPERCCVSKQFSAQLSTSTAMALPDGTTYSSYAYYNYSYDADRAMVGMKGVSFMLPDLHKSNLWIIENINDGQMYVIDQDSKRCDKSPMPIKPLKCIPDTATYLHSSTFGYGDKQIIGDTWLVTVDDTVNYATVSRDGLCVPLTGHSFFQKLAMVNAATTTDFVPKVDDPSIFDIPAECHSAI